MGPDMGNETWAVRVKGESAMDDLLAKLRAGPSGDAVQDRATMHRAAHEIQRLQTQLKDARNQISVPLVAHGG
jgi:hypothetical protein